MTTKTSARLDRVVKEALLAEIPLAMRMKLRRNWRQTCNFLGMFLLVGGIHLLSRTGASEAWFTGFGILSLVMAGLAFAGAIFAGKLSEHEELTYRRQHGKWRWER